MENRPGEGLLNADCFHVGFPQKSDAGIMQRVDKSSTRTAFSCLAFCPSASIRLQWFFPGETPPHEEGPFGHTPQSDG
jgi:hypothetical protein